MYHIIVSIGGRTIILVTIEAPTVCLKTAFLSCHGRSLSLAVAVSRQAWNSSTPQLPFKIPHIPTDKDQKALKRGTLGGLGSL